MQNRYFVLRHGQSTANIDHQIQSDPKLCIDNYGLTELGKEQAQISAKEFKNHFPGIKPIIFTSDFRRAAETAMIFSSELGCASVTFTTKLRERNFGKLNGTDDRNYEQVWALDATNPDHTEWNVESVVSVAERVSNLVSDIEKSLKGKTIVLVAHGDVLQILLTACQGQSARHHRSIPHLRNAEVREISFDEADWKTRIE